MPRRTEAPAFFGPRCPQAHQVHKADGATCAACSLRAQCTQSKNGREVLRYYEEGYVDRVRSYRGTFPYEKALRKRRVWV